MDDAIELWRRAAAEGLAAFALVFAGCGAIIADERYDGALGTLGALVLLAIWPDQPAALGATVPSVGTGSALVYEAILTAVLMFVIIAVATRAPSAPPQRSPSAAPSGSKPCSAGRSPAPR